MKNPIGALWLFSLFVLTLLVGCPEDSTNDPGRSDIVIDNTSSTSLTVIVVLEGVGATQVTSTAPAGARTLVVTNLAGEGVTEPPPAFVTRLELVTDDDRKVLILAPPAATDFVSRRLDGLHEEFVLTVIQSQVDAAQ